MTGNSTSDRFSSKPFRILEPRAVTLATYERTKLALADTLQIAALRIPDERTDLQDTIRDLFKKLAEDRFNLAVVGRFNRGKSSLINAILHTDRLPVGCLPLTATIAQIIYGSRERAWITPEGHQHSLEIEMNDLPAYLTSTTAAVAEARIELPARLLRKGFAIVDTPGLGSAIQANSRNTLAYIPEADAVVLVTSYDSPFSEDERELVALAQRYRHRLFFVIAKEDLISATEKLEIDTYFRTQLLRAGVSTPEIHSVSVAPGFEASVDRFVTRLTRFLINEKQDEFLRSISLRVRGILSASHPEPVEIAKMIETERMAGVLDEADNSTILQESNQTARFTGCSICDRVSERAVAFISSYQYELVTSRSARETFARMGGFCARHSWQYDVLSSPRASCIAYAEALETLVSRLRPLAPCEPAEITSAVSKVRATPDRCSVCRIFDESERTAIAELAATISGSHEGYPGLCLMHLERVLPLIATAERALRLIADSSDAYGTIADDMRRYVVKIDARRRDYIDGDERSAARRGLTVLAGSHGFNGVSRVS